ncbi:hypothetical protein [Sporosarcina sp. FSL W7-1283]|uniref:hypothetical protein n=1 Tax=Sporosarcina sp. FSL W7-1283 TaxID=2921560 RepID=UPI0030F937A4
MKILDRGIMTDNTTIQIEDWSNDYLFMPEGHIIGAYPKSKQTIAGSFKPKLNETYRFEFDFISYEEAKEAFLNLQNGNAELIDYKEHYRGKKEFLVCL